MISSFLMKLTPREYEVFNLLIRGYMHKEIAQELTVSIQTVKNHSSKILEKFQVTNRFDLIISYYGLPGRENDD